MKITKLFYLCTFLLLFQLTESKASHMVGGQITWECLSNGKYVFYMELYRECTGTSFYFNNQIISYQNGTITMKPDSAKWLSYGGDGNISAIGLDGCQRSCFSPAELGAMQFFPYKSDPVTISGYMPSGGWLFTWSSCCRPSSVVNLTSPSARSMTLRAMMYPYQGWYGTPCYDSSPQFKELPAVFFCKGNQNFYHYNVEDTDLDSLVYSWAFPWDQQNTNVDFQQGYAYNNPLPDTSFHPLNIPASLNAQTGEVSFTTYNGQSGQQYATTVQIDSYRNGLKIASVFRDSPFIIFDCPSNSPPVSNIDGMNTENYLDTVHAGEFVSIPVQITDSDTNSGTMLPQTIALEPKGDFFSSNFSDSLNCKDSTLYPCATLSPSPTYDSVTKKVILRNQGSINTLFEWQTTCVHLGIDSANVSNYKTFHYVLKSYDASCLAPATIKPSITIVVERFKPIIQQNGNILSVDSAESYQWYFNGNPIPNSDTNRIFVISHGTYTVEVMKNGCISQQADYRFLSVALDEASLNNKLKVYPNPFKDGFVVELEGLSEKDVSIKMMDIDGKEISFGQTVENGKIYIGGTGNFSSGIYFIKVTTAEAETYRKVIKL